VFSGTHALNCPISSFSFAHSTRGISVGFIIVDEAAFINHAMFFQTIVPLNLVRNTVIVMISSPQGPDNFYTRLMERRHPITGATIFNTLIVEETCAWCARRKNAMECTHVPTQTWLSEDNKRIVREFYASDAELYKREVLGMVVDESGLALDEEVIRTLRESREVALSDTWRASWLILAVDPSLGGTDHTAVTGALIHRGCVSIVTLDSLRLRPKEIMAQQRELIHGLITLLRKHVPAARNAIVVLVVERNGNAEVAHIYDMMRESPELQPFHLYYEDRKREIPGIWSTYQRKQEYLGCLNYFAEQDACVFSGNGVSYSATTTAEEELSPHERFLKKRAMLLEQLARLRRVPLGGDNPGSQRRVTYSGKVNANLKRVSTLRDDLALSTLMCLYILRNVMLGRATFRPR